MNQLTNVFKILSDENRLRMIVLLYQETSYEKSSIK